ncbi:uncharacterized protein LOC144945184 [Lampetra fluviatilis]
METRRTNRTRSPDDASSDSPVGAAGGAEDIGVLPAAPPPAVQPIAASDGTQAAHARLAQLLHAAAAILEQLTLGAAGGEEWPTANVPAIANPAGHVEAEAKCMLGPPGANHDTPRHRRATLPLQDPPATPRHHGCDAVLYMLSTKPSLRSGPSLSLTKTTTQLLYSSGCLSFANSRPQGATGRHFNVASSATRRWWAGRMHKHFVHCQPPWTMTLSLHSSPFPSDKGRHYKQHFSGCLMSTDLLPPHATSSTRDGASQGSRHWRSAPRYSPWQEQLTPAWTMRLLRRIPRPGLQSFQSSAA